MKRVAIVYRFLPQYRIAFYEQLRADLADRGVELMLIYGDGDEEDRRKGDLVDLPWGIKVPNRILTIGSRKLYWQPAFRHLRGVDLIIVEQASRLIINYALLARQHIGGARVAFWGHGRNFQATESNRFAEWLKHHYSRFPYWWFAYNERSAKVLDHLGYPRERVTVVQNAIDTSKLRETLKEIDEEEKERARKRFGIRGTNVGVYVGGLYPEKHLSFLLAAAQRVRESIPDFELLIAGDGIERRIVEDAALKHTWIHYCGPCFGREKALILSLSRVFLMPGVVGLATLDAFSVGLPVLTTDLPFHGPEIEYLIDGENGYVTPHDEDLYAATVVGVFVDEFRYEGLRQSAVSSSLRYTVENMVANFRGGIIDALQ